MDREQILKLFEMVDRELSSPAKLYIYGSGVCILLGEPGRTSLDLDVAGPYSEVNLAEFRHAAEKAGFPINPDEFFAGGHLEWVGPLRLCLPKPKPDTPPMPLWHGKYLEVVAPPPPDLAASKLVRYDETDRADIQFLYSQFPWDWERVREAVERLPEQFRQNPMVKENLQNLKTDMDLWAAS